MSPTAYDPAKPLPLAQATLHHPSPQPRTRSPHIVDQALSRKPITTPGPKNNDTAITPTPPDFTRYRFEPSPSPTPPPPSFLPSDDNLHLHHHHPHPHHPGTPESQQLETDPSIRLDDYDWAGVETEFAAAMRRARAVEEEIWAEWRGWGEVFGAWAGTVSGYDEERAGKRLRTRVAFTRNREEGLEERRVHYIKVVQAFEGALALLGDG